MCASPVQIQVSHARDDGVNHQRNRPTLALLMVELATHANSTFSAALGATARQMGFAKSRLGDLTRQYLHAPI